MRCLRSLAWLTLAALLPGPGLGAMSSVRRGELKELARATWQHGFDAYMRHAFPADELRPLSCTGLGADKDTPANIDVNDVAGDYSLTLLDSLDTFVVMGDKSGFETAVRDVIRHVSFDQDTKVQVFEATIRCLGGLLSGHIFASEAHYGFAIAWYRGELLTLARDLGRRLLPAFDASMTGLPFARVHLRRGVLPGESIETCSAGAGSLVLEFATLSRLTDDDVFERVARKAFFAVWNRRSPLSLVGNTINVQTGNWHYAVASTGAGIDSMYEYALKAHILLADDEFFRVWDEANAAVLRHVRSPEGFVYRAVNMNDGKPVSTVIDSLGAFWAGLQVLSGDLDSAIRAHLVYSNIWQRYSAMPETFDTATSQAISLGYPLRPEFIESTYLLHRATADDYYLGVVERFLRDLVNRTQVDCGLASLSDVTTGERDDRMHSFVLSESLKYAWLLFDGASQPAAYDGNAVWSTEGHLLPLARRHLRRPAARQRGESAVCAAYDPARAGEHWTPLKLGVEGRRDAEYARMIAGLEVDEAHALRTALWSPDGFCHAPRLQDFAVELVFTTGDQDIVEAPRSDQVQPIREGLLISRVAGLKLTLHRRYDTTYDIVRVAHLRVPRGGEVRFTDRLLALSLSTASPAPAPVTLRYGGGAVEASAQPASFGLDFGAVLHAMPLAFIHVPPDANADGCADHQPPANAVVLVRRGACTFGRKAAAVKPQGVTVVLVVDHAADGDAPPVANGDPASGVGVPLALVSHAVGEAVLALHKGSDAPTSVQLVGPPPALAPPAEVVLNGYRVHNAKLLVP